MPLHTVTRFWMATAAAASVTGLLAGSGPVPLTPSAMRNHAAIGYQQVPPQDAVARLNERLRRGEVRLDFETTTGYLRSVLAALDVPVDSQMLVFSKTSFQARRINPSNPRALFFNDSVAVGWVRGGEVLEFAAQDPQQGTMFYTLEQTPSAPQFTRDLSCIQCHTWDATLNVPGMFLGSVYPAADGSVLYAPAYNIDHRTPFELRWGGWYVTGDHSIPRHMGNARAPAGTERDQIVTPATLNLTTLEGRFDMTGYPSPQSDIVALMVMEHEARMLNLITRAGWEARLGREAGRPLEETVTELVDYLLFVDEEPLPGPVAGRSTFAKTFMSRGPRDSRGRSLRDLDLTTRLMRYPCSFLVYSESFDALPALVKTAVYTRMADILSGSAPEPRYARLTAESRQAVLDILRDTKPDLPDIFTRAQ